MLLALPILIAFATAIVLKALPYRPLLLRAVAFAGALALLAAAVAILVRVVTAGVQVLQIGGWPAPFGITLAADPFSAILITMVGASIWGAQARVGCLRPGYRIRLVWHRTRRIPWQWPARVRSPAHARTYR